MALFKNIGQFSVETPLPPFIAKIYALLDLAESRESFCWSDRKSIFIKNPSRLEKIILPKMFTGLTLDRFYERMQRYGYAQDKTWLAEGVMLRLRILVRQSKQIKKDPIDQWRGSGARTQFQQLQQSQLAPNTASKPNVDRSLTKAQQPVSAIVNSAGLSASEMSELQRFRSIVCEKISGIQDELRKLKERHPNQSADLLSMIKYTNSMLRIGSEVVSSRKN